MPVCPVRLREAAPVPRRLFQAIVSYSDSSMDGDVFIISEVGNGQPRGIPGVQWSRQSKGEQERMEFSSIEAAIDDIRAGKIVIVVDDEDRENEGDFIMAAEKCTPETMNI